MILLKLFTAVVALTATATARVVRRDAEAAAAVNATTFADLILYEQYSAATYCTGNDVFQPGTEIACPAGNCPNVEQAHAVTWYSFLNAGVGGVTGFIAVDTANSVIVLAFRGARSVENWVSKLDTRLVDTSLCANCQVHQGFQNSWDSVSVRITRELTNAAAANSAITTLVVTGHGLGGALATLAATQYRNTPVTGLGLTRLFTYGSPRVGNTAFATFVTGQGGTTNNFRATHTDDPIPKLPSRTLGYLQWGPEYWIRADTGVTVHANDIDEIDGVETSTGNAGTLPTFDIPAHEWYFNAVAACI